jgi:hypothetical protein
MIILPAARNDSFLTIYDRGAERLTFDRVRYNCWLLFGFSIEGMVCAGEIPDFMTVKV